MKNKILLAYFSLFVFSLSAMASTIGLNDLTILLPLPNNQTELGQMLGPRNQNFKNYLIPFDYYQKLPKAIFQAESSDYTYSNFRVVGIRFDPCFKVNSECLPQIRLVWQPIGFAESYGVPMPGLGLETKDAALHTFYTFSKDQFAAILNRVVKLRGAAYEKDWEDLPLMVHPIIKQQGLNGEYFQELRNIILENCNRNNMWRMTVMKTIPGGDIWSFSGFDLSANKLPTPIIIPQTTDATEETLQLSLSSVDSRNFVSGIIAPQPNGEFTINSLINFSKSFELDLNKSTEVASVIKKIENPHLSNPGTVDCVSCHAAQVAGAIITRMHPSISDNESTDSSIYINQFRSPYKLSTTGGKLDQPNVLRALGYFGKTPIISRRVINETADIAEILSRNEK